MRCIVALLAVLVLTGCVARQQAPVEPVPQEPVLYFELAIPRHFQSELRGWKGGVPGYERYAGAFGRGWWMCVSNYLSDIGYESKPSDAYGIGWYQAVAGWSDGYQNAERQIQWNIKTFGPERTHAYLLYISANVMAE